MSGQLDDDNDPDAKIEEEPINEQLQEVLEFYDCDDLLPFVQRVVWLNTIREALGHIPMSLFKLNYEEIVALTILIEENNKKMQHDNLQMKRQGDDMRTKAATQAASSASKNR